MRAILLALLLAFLFPASVAAGEIWRWVDEDGSVHYSDRPRPGAERVQIGTPQTFTPPPIPARPEPPARPRDTPEEALPGYRRLSIASPSEGEVRWNIGGELTIELDVQPALASGHELVVYLDGDRVADVPQGPTRFTIREVWRGERRLRVSITDQQGRELASSDTVVFYVQQASLLNPNRPRPPGGG